MEKNPFMSANELADLLGFCVNTIYRFNRIGRIPLAMRFGLTLKWLRTEIESWIAAGCPDRKAWERMKEGPTATQDGSAQAVALTQATPQKQPGLLQFKPIALLRCPFMTMSPADNVKYERWAFSRVVRTSMLPVRELKRKYEDFQEEIPLSS